MNSLKERKEDEGAEADLQVAEVIAAREQVEKKLIQLIEELSQKYTHEQLTDETKSLLKSAFEAYEKNNDVKDSTDEDRLLRDTWASLFSIGSATAAERPRADHQTAQISSQGGISPFKHYAEIGNPWQPWASGNPAHSAADGDITMPDLSEALNEARITSSEHVREDRRPDDIRLNETEHSVQALDSAVIGRSGQDEQPPADHDITLVEQQEQHVDIKVEQPETVNIVELVDNQRLSVHANQAYQREDCPATMRSQPVPGQCRNCGRSFRSQNSLWRHLEATYGLKRRLSRDPRKYSEETAVSKQEHVKQEYVIYQE
ncbi:MAG: hypothetical protein Q9181_006354 [Wetmoreana brouardii]